jgi:membrane-associated PAP2 superfamily phosphatase
MTLLSPDARRLRHRTALATVVSFFLLAGWDYSGLDLVMAHWFGDATGFSGESHWLWRTVLHDKILPFPWILEFGLLAGIVWPWGSLKKLPKLRRTQLALTTLAALLTISNIKLQSHTSCPWDLAEFGKTASYVSHWAWGVRDGGSGGCFPAGHASAGFAFLGGFFVFRRVLPNTAWRWLAGAMAAGLILGLAQQVRGAHYMSHTLWTAWLCWTVAAAADAAVTWLAARQASRTPAPVPLAPRSGLVPLE